MDVKLGICNFCFPGTGLFAPQLVKEVGLDGMSVEYGAYEKGYPLSQKIIRDLYLDAQQKYGIEYANVGCSDGDFLPFHMRPSDPRFEKVRKAHLDAVDAAAYMKIPVVFFSNFNASLVQTEEDMEFTAKRYQELCDYAGEKEIQIGCECPLSVEKQLELVERVGKPNFKLFYDSDNYSFCTSFQQVDVLDGIYPHMLNQLHVKDSTQGCIANAILGTGVSNFQGSIDYLKAHQYSGWLIIENLYEKEDFQNVSEERIESVKEDVRRLKEAVK